MKYLDFNTDDLNVPASLSEKLQFTIINHINIIDQLVFTKLVYDQSYKLFIHFSRKAVKICSHYSGRKPVVIETIKMIKCIPISRWSSKFVDLL